MQRWILKLCVVGFAATMAACDEPQTTAPDSPDVDPFLGAQLWVKFPFAYGSWGEYTGVNGDRTAGGWINVCGSQRMSHSGADYYARDMSHVQSGNTLNRPIIAGIDGEIVKASWTDCYGNDVVIYDKTRHVAVRYSHLNSIWDGIRPGVRVNVGQLIGRVGNTGCGSFNPHLHIVAYENVNDNNGNPIIPYVCDSDKYSCIIRFY